MAGSPVQRGFQVAFRRPSIVLTEIVWRWMFGAAALALVAAGVLLYLDTLPVSDVELWALSSRSRWLAVDALIHIFAGSGPMLVRLFLILAPALAVLWMAMASLGRMLTLRALLGRRVREAKAAVVGLHFLRAALAMAALIAYLGAMVVATLAASRGSEYRPVVFFLVFLLMAWLISILRSRTAWFLMLAAVFAVRDGRDTFGAIDDAVRVFRRRRRQFFAVGSVFAIVHLILFAIGTVLTLAVMGMIGRAPLSSVVAMAATVTLIYWAITDWIYVARLAAYVAIAEGGEAALEPAVPTFEPAPVASS